MPSYQVVVPHSLGIDEACARLRVLLSEVRNDYAALMSDVSGSWTGNLLRFNFKAAGMPVSGELIVEEASVKVCGQLPLAAALFRGRIEQTIRDELKKLLS